MRLWREFAVIAILTVMSGAQAWSQDQDLDQSPPPPPTDEQSMEIPPAIPHVAKYGVVIPAGWNLGMTADALGVYDTNPAFQLQPAADEAQRYSGDAFLTYLTQHTVYQADYVSSFMYYQQFTSLNSHEQDFSQSLWHDFSPHTSFGWRLDAREYPSWGGSSFASSSFGSLLMQLSGLTGLNLLSNVSNATTAFTLDHKLSRRSSFHADLSGGVSKYVQSDSNQLVSLLTAPDSSTWSGQIGLSYDYHLDAHRSLGAGISSSYFIFTVPNYHSLEQSAVFRYSEVFRDGWSCTAAAGPQFREQQSSLGGLQPGLGLTIDVGQRTRKSAFRATVANSYQIGQAQGNLTSWTASGSFEHAIGRRYFAGIFGTYQRSESQVATGSLGSGITQTIAPAVEGGVRLNRHIAWFANYGFSAQKGALTQQKEIDRQQFVSGLSFNFDSLFPL